MEKDCFIMLHQVQTWCAMCTDACRKRIMCTITCATLSADSLDGNIANPIHGFTIAIDYGKFILTDCS